MRCVIDCMCGGHHLAQCSCSKKGKMKRNQGELVCKQIKVLPKCCQYHPDLPVRVIMNHVIDKKTGEIKEYHREKKAIKNES